MTDTSREEQETPARRGRRGGLASIRRLSARVFGNRGHLSATQQETGGGTWPLEGYFTCGSGLLVAHECLGQSFRTRTATYELTITLPELDSTNALAPLRRPPWRFNREGRAPAAVVDEEWGHLGSLRSRNPGEPWTDYPALVRQCIVASTVEAENDEQFRTAAVALADELDVWWSSVTDWLGVLVAQDFAGLGTRRYSLLEHGFHAWSGDENGVRRAGTGKAVTVAQGYPEVLGRDQLQRAMDLAASGQRPPDEWRFIRDARSLLRAGEYRRAVIDAATAAELTLTSLLNWHFSATSTDTTISEALLDRSQTLRGRRILVDKLMRGTVPARFQQEVEEPRNFAAHEGRVLTRQTDEAAVAEAAIARAAVAKATELVEVAYPLSGFV